MGDSVPQGEYNNVKIGIDNNENGLNLHTDMPSRTANNLGNLDNPNEGLNPNTVHATNTSW